MNRALSRGRRTAASQLFRALLLPVAAALAVSGCHRSAGAAQGIAVEESIAPQPVSMGSEAVTLRLADAAGHPLTHAHIQVEGDMNHPGMAPVFSNAIETAPGSYQAPLTFTMGGDWVVLAHITLADGRRIERQWDVKGVESH
jgi:hypothetical protein